MSRFNKKKLHSYNVSMMMNNGVYTIFVQTDGDDIVQYDNFIHSDSILNLFQGSGVIKAGFAGGHIPKCCFPN